MKNMLTAALAIFAISFTLPESAGRLGNEFASGWKTFSDNNYSIEYPDSFELDNSGQMGMRFMLLSKQTSDADMFRENINLIIQDLSGHQIDLDQYVDISLEQIGTMLVGGKVIESNRIKNKDGEFQKVVFEGKQGEYDLKWMQYYWVKSEKAYVLTFTSELNQYNTYIGIGEKMMNTFKFK